MKLYRIGRPRAARPPVVWWGMLVVPICEDDCSPAGWQTARKSSPDDHTRDTPDGDRSPLACSPCGVFATVANRIAGMSTQAVLRCPSWSSQNSLIRVARRRAAIARPNNPRRTPPGVARNRQPHRRHRHRSPSFRSARPAHCGQDGFKVPNAAFISARPPCCRRHVLICSHKCLGRSCRYKPERWTCRTLPKSLFAIWLGENLEPLRPQSAYYKGKSTSCGQEKSGVHLPAGRAGRRLGGTRVLSLCFA